MFVGVPKEIKTHEYRVGMVPSGVREMVGHGHGVLVQSGAGAAIGFDDDAYKAAGAEIANEAAEVFERAELIVKVKEPQPEECAMLRPGQVLFTYLHLAADKPQTQALMASGCSAVAYETVTDRRGRLPLLAPMSEVAGRMGAQVGAHCLEKEQGGSGVLLPGVPGVPAGKVVVIGGGVAGANAARMALGLEARVVIIEKSLERLDELDAFFGPRLDAVYSTTEAIETHVPGADLVIGSVLVPGAAAPKLVSRELVRRMRPGSVIVDIAIDQGGCCETSRPTTHAAPTFVAEGMVHYCVTNMPGAVARTSTFALNNATLPRAIALADKGLVRAMAEDAYLRNGLNVHDGKLTCGPVAQALDLPYTPVEEALGINP